MTKRTHLARSGVTSTRGLTPARERLLRGILLGTTAIVGVALASPATAQTTVATPRQGGTITAQNAYPLNVVDSTQGGTGGVYVGNIYDENNYYANRPITLNGVTINATTNSGPSTADAFFAESNPGNTNSVNLTGTNTLTTSVNGGAALHVTAGANLGVDLGAGTSTLTGSYGILVSNPGFYVIYGNGFTANLVGSGTHVAGVSVNAGGDYYGGVDASTGRLNISGFDTGITVTVGDGVATVNTSGGGTISANTTGIAANGLNGAGASVTSGSAITVGSSGVGINAASNGGAISVTTVAGGTINGSGTGANASNYGIYAAGASGSNNTSVTVGAAIGGTAVPGFAGVSFNGSAGAGATNTLQVNANVTGRDAGITTNGGTAALVAVTVANGVTVSGGTGLFNYSGGVTVSNFGTISGVGNSVGVASSTGIVSITNNGTVSGTTAFRNYSGGLNLINQGTVTGTGGTAILASANSAASNISLLAGSVMNGAITLGNADDTLQFYNGQGASPAASFGSVNLGGGTNALVLRGIGDDRTGGTGGNGAAGTIDTSTIANVTNLTKQDAGTWLLTGSAAYTGTTTISGGTLVESNTASALGNGTVSIASGATLEIANTTGLLYTKGTTFTGAGTIKFTGNQPTAIGYGGNGNTVISLSSGGLIDVEGGIVNGSSSSQGFYTGNQGSLNIAAGAIFDGVEGTVIVDKLTGSGTLRGGYGTSGSTTIGIANGSSSFSGTITDDPNPNSPLRLIKVGTGNITLNKSSSYTGGTTISDGALSAAVVDALGIGAVTDNAALLFQTATATGTIANAIGGSGTLYAQTFPVNGTQTYSGALTGGLALSIGNGFATNVVLGNDGNTRTGTTTIGSGSTLQGTVLSLTSGVVTDSGTLTFTGASGSYGAAISSTGSVTVGLDNGNTLTLTGANTYSGITTINAGATLQGKAGINTATRTLSDTSPIIDNGTLFLSQNGQGGSYDASVTTSTDGGGAVAISNTGAGTLTLNGQIGTATTRLGHLDLANANVVLGANVFLTNALTTAGGTLTNDAVVTTYGSVEGVFATGTVNNGGTAFHNAQIIGGNTGINSVGSASLTVDNYGYIKGQQFEGVTKRGGGTLTLTNEASGVIYAQGTQEGTAWGVGSYGTSSPTSIGVTNYGLIVGVGYGVYGTNAADSVINSGTIAAGTYTVPNAGDFSTGTISNVGGTAGVRLDGGGHVTNSTTSSLIEGSRGVYSTAGTLALTNYGTVLGASATLAAIDTVGAGSTVTNYGTVQGGAQGIVLNNGGTVYNYGTGSAIKGTGTTNLTDASGIYSNGNLSLTNQGAISTAHSGTVYGVEVRGVGTITNTGSITAASGAAGVYLSGGGTITNGSSAFTAAQNAASSIQGSTAINAAGGSLTLDNAGTVTGLISTASGVPLTIVNRVGGTIQSTGATGDLIYPSNAAVTIVNAGLMRAAGFSATGSQGTGATTITNAATGVLRGGTDTSYAQFGNAVQYGGTGTLVFSNYGSATSDGNLNAVNGTNSGVVTLNLCAGSTTGKIGLGSGNDTINLYTGIVGAVAVTTADPVLGGSNTVLVRAAGTYGAATFGTINLGGGSNTIALNGNGTEAVAAITGQQGSLALNTVTGLTTLVKADAGNWVLSGAATGTTAAATIYAGNQTSTGARGILQFSGTTGLTGQIYQNGVTIQVSGNGATGTGTLHIVSAAAGQSDLTFVSNSTIANAIRLETSGAATLLQANAGVIGALTGNITTGIGNNIDGQAIAAAQAVTVTGGGTIALTGANGWTGLTTISNGSTLSVAAAGNVGTGGFAIGDAATAGTLTTTNAAAITLGGGVALGAGGATVIVANATATPGSGNTTLSGVVSGAALTKTGAGTLTLSGNETYTGATTISAGTLALTGAGSIAASSGVVDNATFTIAGHSGGTTIAGLSGAGGVTLGANTLTLSNGGAYAGVASGTGGLTIAAGTEILTGDNSYTGTTTLSGGSLTLGNGGTTGSVAGPIALTAGVLTINHSNAVTLASAISGGGSLVQAGTGTTTLSGANTYIGTTTVSAGTLALSGGAAIADTGAVSVAGGAT
uniref:autotransporter-associated beta strand repeat-containing protein n=1 Tax=Sphingomonas bacterium TaxID=1895847 RepID=UPI0015772EB9